MRTNMGLERCLRTAGAASYARLISRGHPQCKMEHTPIDVSEYLLGREKFCKDFQTGRLGTGVMNRVVGNQNRILGPKLMRKLL